MAGLSERPMSMRMSTRVTDSSPVRRSISTSDDGGAVGEVEERVAPAGLAVEVDAGRGVEARVRRGRRAPRRPAGRARRRRADRPGRRTSNTPAALETDVRRRGRDPVGGRGEVPARPPRRAGPSSVSQARSAAVPFRSVLAEAAVGEVLLFFSVEVGITRTASIGSANASATIWRILVLSPWPISVPPVETWIVPSR